APVTTRRSSAGLGGYSFLNQANWSCMRRLLLRSATFCRSDYRSKAWLRAHEPSSNQESAELPIPGNTSRSYRWTILQWSPMAPGCCRRLVAAKVHSAKPLARLPASAEVCAKDALSHGV